MRSLQTTDIFAAARIVKSAQIADEVKTIAAAMDEKKEVSALDFGVEFIVRVFEKLVGTESEKAIYKFLSGPLEIPEKEIATMDVIELIDKVMELKEVVDVERWKSFFAQLSKFLPKVS